MSDDAVPRDAVHYEEGPRPRMRIPRMASQLQTSTGGRKGSSASEPGRTTDRGSRTDSETDSSLGDSIGSTGSMGKRRKFGVASLERQHNSTSEPIFSLIVTADGEPRYAHPSSQQTDEGRDENVGSPEGVFSDNPSDNPVHFFRCNRSFSVGEGHNLVVAETESSRKSNAALQLLRRQTLDYSPWDSQEQDDKDEPASQGTKRDTFIPVVDFEKLRKISRADQTDLAKLKDMTKQLNLNPRRPSYLTWRETTQTGVSCQRHPMHPLRELSVDTDLYNINVCGEDTTSACSEPPSPVPGWSDALGCVIPGVSIQLADDDCDTNDCKCDIVKETAELDTHTRHKGLSERCQNIDKSLEWLKSELMEMRTQDYTLAKQLVRLRKEIQHIKLERCCQENSNLLEDAIDEVAEEREMELFDFCDILPRLFNPQLKHYGLTRMNINTRRFSVF